MPAWRLELNARHEVGNGPHTEAWLAYWRRTNEMWAAKGTGNQPQMGAANLANWDEYVTTFKTAKSVTGCEAYDVNFPTPEYLEELKRQAAIDKRHYLGQ